MGFVTGFSIYALVLAAITATLLSRRPEQFILDRMKEPYFNNKSCRILDAVGACEDVVPDETTGLVYTASGKKEHRLRYCPPLGKYDLNLEEPAYHDKVYLFDPKNEDFTQLKMPENYTTSDYVAHGMAVRSFEPGVNTLFLINHQRTGSVVSIFKHVIGTDSLIHVHDIKNSYIWNPNSIAPVSETRFYITNDFYFRKKIGRIAESLLQPLPISNVVYCDISNPDKPQCNHAAKHLTYANGIEYVEKSSNIVVHETFRGTLLKYNYDPKNPKTLEYVSQTPIGAALDNVRRIPGTDDLTSIAFPDPNKTVAFLHTLDNSIPVPQMAVILRAEDGYTKPEVGFHSYDSLPFMTGGVFLPEHKKFIGASILTEGLLVCDTA